MLRFATLVARYLWLDGGRNEAAVETERIMRLKELVDRLERLPASPDRDRVLAEVRSRTVDLDTGVSPRAMLPMREPVPPVPSQPKHHPAPEARRTPPPRRPVAPSAAPTSTSNGGQDFYFAADLLSLDDSLPLTPPGAAPWARGLRA
jgi:hypothetical protein